MRFRVTTERLEELTLDEMAALEALTYGENARIGLLRDILGQFVADEEGNWLDPAEGRKAVGALRVRELRAVAAEFAEALRGELLPNPSGGS